MTTSIIATLATEIVRAHLAEGAITEDTAIHYGKADAGGRYVIVEGTDRGAWWTNGDAIWGDVRSHNGEPHVIVLDADGEQILL